MFIISKNNKPTDPKITVGNHAANMGWSSPRVAEVRAEK